MCALIRPGIHENLMISSKTKVNEHGTLELVIASAQSEDAELLAFQNNMVNISMESNIRFYPPSLTDFDKVVKKPGEIGQELRRMRFQLNEYAKLYATQEQIDKYIGGMSMFEGLGIPPADYGKALKMVVQKDFLEKVVTNLATRFIKFLQDAKVYESNILFRQKFLRQSKDKNYAVIPTSDFDVWIEPMAILAEHSKIAFSDWEIKNGKNDPNPAASSSTKNMSKTDVNTGKNLFGTPADAVTPPVGVTPPMPEVAAPPVIPAPVAETPVVPAAAIPPVAQPIVAEVIPPVAASPASASGFFTK